MFQLTRRQVKSADRVGGIELLIPWPRVLDDVPVPGEDTLRFPGDTIEAPHGIKEWADGLVAPTCQSFGLVPVHVRVTLAKRPGWSARRYVAVTIIGRRWVHASTTRKPQRMYA